MQPYFVFITMNMPLVGCLCANSCTKNQFNLFSPWLDEWCSENIWSEHFAERRHIPTSDAGNLASWQLYTLRYTLRWLGLAIFS